MSTAFLWTILLLLGLALAISVMAYVRAVRRAAADIRALAEKLAREATARHESEERHQLLVENAPDAIITLDAEGNFTSINSFCEMLTGWTHEECMNRQFLSVVHPDDLGRAKAGIADALNGRKTPMTEIRVQNKTGEYISIEFTVTPQFRRARVLGMLVIGRDISARHKAERAQAALELQLRRAQKMEAIGRLAGGIAHDFNNFLAVILANCGLARMDIIVGHPAAERLDQINKATQRAAALVQQILTFSSTREQERCVMNLKVALKEAATMLRSTLPRSIEVRTQFGANCPFVLADAGQIQQVLLNLATNSAHAMEAKGGVLDISLDTIEVDEEFAQRNPDLRPGPHVRLTVGDSGHGMDAATLEHIFEPFYTTKPQGEGTGLGLSVVHGIVKSHEGAITVYSEVGRGTAFNIYFPASKGSVPAAVENQSPTFPLGDGEHILFVDDEKSLVDCGQRVLQRLGYRVTAVLSAREALELIRAGAETFDCILADFTMPGMSGIALARECRSLLPATPIILMSGYCGVLTTDSLRPQGIRELILKPFTPQTLAEAVKRALTEEENGGGLN